MSFLNNKNNKRIVFHVINGVGLGHLIRAIAVAEAIGGLNKEVDILFVTNSRFTRIIKDAGFAFLKISGKTYGEMDGKAIRLLENRVGSRNIDAIVYDTHFSLDILYYFKEMGVKNIVILRKLRNSDFKEYFNKYYGDLDLILLPHSKKEISEYRGGKKLIDLFSNFSRVKFVGPIVKRPPQLKHVRNKNKFNVLVICGGGGQDKNNTGIKKFLLTVGQSVKKIKGKIKNLNLIIITGPLYKGKISINGAKTIKWHENLLDIMKSADLLISTAGYNICNEIVLAKTPAILIPLSRYKESQTERVERLARKGVAIILKSFQHKILVKMVIGLYNNRMELKKMKKNFKNTKLEIGNEKAAKQILKLISNKKN